MLSQRGLEVTSSRKDLNSPKYTPIKIDDSELKRTDGIDIKDEEAIYSGQVRNVIKSPNGRDFVREG